MSALVPALAARYLKLEAIRHDYPLVLLPDADPAVCAAPLATLLDEALDASAPETERPEALRRDAYRIEARVKRLLEEGEEAGLHALWRRAVDELAGAGAAPDEGLLRVGESLAERLPGGSLLGCTPASAAVILEHAAAAVRRVAAERDLARLEEMATTLDEALAGERARSAEAASATSLRATLGDPASSGLDPDALGRVLAASGAFGPEPSERAERLRTARHAVEEARRDVERTQVAPAVPATTIAAGISQWQAELRRRVAVARAAHLARLALDTRYRPEHDGRPPTLTTTDLTADQLAELPPTLVVLDSERLDDAERSRLVELLAGETPLTVLLAVRRLSGPGGEWLARIGSAALALGDAFVVQAALSQLPQLTAELAAALRHPGPGLVAIYTGCEAPADGVATYLRAAAAVESRAFPSFVVDPAAGADIAGRLSLPGNPQPDRTWPVHPLFYEAADGSPVEEEAAFTAADFLALEAPSDAALAIIADGAGDDRIAPIADLLNGADAATARRVPYLLLVDDEGRLQRAVVSPAAVAAARRAGRQWQRLQALAAPPAAPAAPTAVEELATEPSAAEAPPSPEVLTAAPPAEATPAPAGAAQRDAAWIDSASCTTCEECVQRNSAMFAYNDAKQAYIKDITAGTYRQLVEAAEVCPVAIIHPGKPRDPNEPGLEELVARAAALA